MMRGSRIVPLGARFFIVRVPELTHGIAARLHVLWHLLLAFLHGTRTPVGCTFRTLGVRRTPTRAAQSLHPRRLLASTTPTLQRAHFRPLLH